MDSVLTRKLFRKRYFQFNPPKKFNNGGLSSLEKGIIAASFAAPLLQSTKAPGQSTIAATAASLGKGFEKLPDTLLAIQKAKPTGVESVRQATEGEKINLGFSPEDNVNVKVKNGVVTGIASKPTAGERDKAADRVAAFDSLDRIEAGLKKVKTGPVSGRIAKTQAFLGFNKDAALLNTEIEDFRKSIIKALRGAQVGVAEEASFDAVLPSISDPPDVIAAKIEVARNKLGNIEKRLNPNGVVSTRLKAEEVAKQDAALFEKFGIAFNLDTNFDSSLETFNPDGTPAR
jgi:hypothetical protein